MEPELIAFFPHLEAEGYRVVAGADGQYNCFAWAAGRTTEWWEPPGDGGDYWPPDVATDRTLGAFVAAYAFKGRWAE